MAGKQRRRGGITLLVVVVGVAALLWSGYWYGANRLVASTIADTARGFAAKGQMIACDEQGITGFPLSLELDCRSARFADADSGVSGALTGLSASAPLYWPGAVKAALSGPLTLDLGNQDNGLTASWRRLEGTAEAGMNGLASVSVNADELLVAPEGDKAAFPVSRIAAAHADLAARPAADRDYRFTVAADDVIVNRSNGKPWPTFSGAADLVAADLGGGLGTDPAETLRDWLRSGAAIVVDRLAVSSQGVSATATGDLSVSVEGIVSGTLNVRLVGLEGLPDLAAQVRSKYRSTAEQVVGVVGAFSKPVDGQPNARDVPVAIRSGVVSIGVFPVTTLPPLTF